jgi:hypothetical protein
MHLSYTLLAIILLLWAGMILGISFLEAWVKFRAPSLSKPVGLDVGRTVFRAFHQAQWMLIAIFLAAMAFLPGVCLYSLYLLIPLLAGSLLSVQAFWLFPPLCRNVELILANKEPIKGPYHWIYGVVEISKLFLLLAGSFWLLAAYI